jgi:transcription-repair coupling factor (superfamily II helicase)
LLPSLIDAFRDLPAYGAVSAQLPASGEIVRAGGLVGSSSAALVASLVQDHQQRVFMVMTESPADAERWFADLEVLVPGVVRLYPQREALGEEEPHLEIAGERVETIEALLQGQARVLVTTLRATAELTPVARSVDEGRLTISKGSELRPEDVAEKLETMGYERVPSVRDVAQFAVRGGILDIYGFGMAGPTRMEWWGDEIISAREFDLDTQRSSGEKDSVTVLPVSGSKRVGANGDFDRLSILEIIPPETVLVTEGHGELSEVQRLWEEAAHHLELAERRGEDVQSREVLFCNPDGWSGIRGKFASIEIGGSEPDHDFFLGEPTRVDRNISELTKVVSAGATLILCDNEGQLERLEELLSPKSGGTPGGGPPDNATLALGALSAGFKMPELMVLTDHEIFTRARRLRRARRYRQAVALADEALKSGDYVVHLDHGVGIYRSTDTITLGEGNDIEVAVIEYEGGDRLNVPLYRIDQIERFRSADGADRVPPKLHKLGGTRWGKQRKKTESAIKRMAAELVELYARRSVASGFAFPPDTRWQAELESSFLYEDTPDQRTASDEVKRAMEQAPVMDRLVIGDVGYGKTEIAVRAAFKAVMSGKQVAILVPTTILAEQHGSTFGDRMANFPVRIEVLSRFRSAAMQRKVLEDLKVGKVDIVIGTHRLLSKDVHFKDLGLLVVDEEHRFGVRHKEKLKQLRLNIDILTLTATPIPRTLHFALSGLRDMSLIETAPRDRSPVLTFVEPWDDVLIEEVIARELDRGGQVFFVHNRVETIETIAARVRRLAPNASLAVGHGQMKEADLDQVMRRFVSGELDILVSTMIVESGLDVPNANTMIVSRAEYFGLAQLYQLRGRVGRGHRRAYCYLLVPDNLDPAAEERLKLMEHHTELGSGYRLAVRDLEHRGAGNLLGSEQSGHAHNVGMDLYLRMLNDMVRALRGEEAGEIHPPPEVYFDGSAHIPTSYVNDERAKLDFYRRLARVAELSEIAQLRSELRDRFGPIPVEAERLLASTELRFLGARLGIESITVRGDVTRVGFRTGAAPRLARLTTALDEVQFEAEVRRAMPLSLRLTRLGGLQSGPGLVRAFATALGKEIPSAAENDRS